MDLLCLIRNLTGEMLKDKIQNKNFSQGGKK